MWRCGRRWGPPPHRPARLCRVVVQAALAGITWHLPLAAATPFRDRAVAGASMWDGGALTSFAVAMVCMGAPLDLRSRAHEVFR